MVDEYIDVKHGRKQAQYKHPVLEEILSETHGVMVYQEQVQRAANVLAGYSLGEADILRRAMGKKKKEVMEAEAKRFVERAKEKGIKTPPSKTTTPPRRPPHPLRSPPDRRTRCPPRG